MPGKILPIQRSRTRLIDECELPHSPPRRSSPWLHWELLMAEEARAGRSALAGEQPCRGGGGGRQQQQQQYQYQHEHEHEHEHRQSKLPARELVDQCEVQRQVVPPPPTEKMESREAADKTTQRHA
ncbi:conserved hypothetical protein [Coccidioides posadasii str. Silveira]|uniref:Uncharacterized protein n=1 Tax=Coccidioides posadasii (strain RMSCC 757 / Silveira) TaxID=443226 RepID=E9CYB3_COCPS|nr:conserved hypothetical protein [Coccidioides posadasii str. Silveira]